MCINSNVLRSADLFLIKKFTNLLMMNGKKNRAYKIFSAAAHEFFRRSRQGPGPLKAGPLGALPGGELFSQLRVAVGNVQPTLECRKCRVAGSSRLVPAIVSEKRGRTLAVRWIVESARRRRRNTPFFQCLSQELLDAYQKQGRPRQRREEYHKVAQGNRGALRYRWW